ncbi:MAG: Rab family GTPase [Candidatus Sifarchaeia archaeon]|jgi:small GTP-binding protein
MYKGGFIIKKLKLEGTRAISNSEKTRYVFKIVILGDPAVGKTSLTRRYVDNMFSKDYLMTIGTNIQTKKVHIHDNAITLNIWDLAGQPLFKNLHPAYCKGANGAVLVLDLTRQNTLNNLHGWAQALWDFVGKVPLVFVGNKADLKSIREVSKEQLLDFAHFSDAKYFETSAKTGEGVMEAFLYLANVNITQALVKNPSMK